MATYYWVGGSGTWNNSTTTNWAASSGGAGGAGVPTNADSVVFDSNSGTAATVTVASTAVSASISANKADINLSLSGSPTLCTGLFTLRQGTLTLNTYTLTTGRFNSDWVFGGSTRAIAFGTGKISLTGSGSIIWNTSDVTNLTVTGTPVVNCTYSGATGTRTIASGGLSESLAISFNITAGTDTVSFSIADTYKNINFTGFAGTLSNVAITIYGNLTVSTGMSFTGGTNTTTFAATSGTQTVTSNGKTLLFPVTKSGAGTLQLVDNLTIDPAYDFDLSVGILNLNGKTLSAGIFNTNNSNVRSISFNAGKIQVTHNSGNTQVINGDTITNFSYTGTPNFEVIGTGTGDYQVRWGKTGGSESVAINVSFLKTTACTMLSGSTPIYYKNVVVDCSLATVDFGTSNIYGDITFTTFGSLAGGSTLQFLASAATQKITSNGLSVSSLDMTINSAGTTVQVQDNLTIGPITLTAGALDVNDKIITTTVFSSSNSNARNIAFGIGEIHLTSSSTTIWSLATITGFSYTGTAKVVCTTNAGSGSRTIQHGSTAGGSESNAVSFYFTAGTDTANVSGHIKTLDFTGFSGAMSNSTKNLYGDLVVTSGMTVSSGTAVLSFLGTSAQKLTTAGKTFDFPITINGVSGSVQLQDSLSMGSTRTLTFTSGTLDCNNKNVTTGFFSSSNTNARTLTMGIGLWTIAGSGASAWNTATSTGMTVNSGTSLINMTSGSAKTFAGGGMTWYNLNQGGLGALTITGSNTFNNISNTVRPATVTFTAGTTTTLGNLTLTGTSGNLITINSSVAGSAANLVKVGGGPVNDNYLSIKDSHATPANTWYAGANSVNVSNNTGWIFTAAPAVSNNFFLVL